MRTRTMAWAAAAAVTALVTVASAAQGAAPQQQRTLTHTTQVVVRAVSSAGRVTPGFSVSRESGYVDCTFDFASPSTVDPDVLECSPSAANATACWLSRTPHHALCLLDPRKKQLFSTRRKGVMAQALPHVAAKRGPLGLRLADGTYCSIRINGATDGLQGHPHYTNMYFCADGAEAIWAPASDNGWGIDRSHPVWTVRTAPADGQGSLRTRNVAKVWFVGMHS